MTHKKKIIFRKLRKPRVTRIHMNLFASMILQCLVRLVIYADQFIVRHLQDSKNQLEKNFDEEKNFILGRTFFPRNIFCLSPNFFPIVL